MEQTNIKMSQLRFMGHHPFSAPSKRDFSLPFQLNLDPCGYATGD
jgi:hypothetical protein